MYTLTLDGAIVLETDSYRKLYRYLRIKMAGGLAFGIDYPTMRAYGYKIIVSKETA